MYTQIYNSFKHTSATSSTKQTITIDILSSEILTPEWLKTEWRS